VRERLKRSCGWVWWWFVHNVDPDDGGKKNKRRFHPFLRASPAAMVASRCIEYERMKKERAERRHV